jgi:hypothetical protein
LYRLRKIPGKEAYVVIPEVTVNRPQDRLFTNSRILIPSRGNVEKSPGVNPVQAVVPGFVKVYQPGRPFRFTEPGKDRPVPIQGPYFIVITLTKTVIFPVYFERPDQIVYPVPDDPVTHHKFGVGVVDHRPPGPQIEKHRGGSRKGFIVNAVMAGKVFSYFPQELPFSSGPLEPGLKRQIPRGPGGIPGFPEGRI